MYFPMRTPTSWDLHFIRMAMLVSQKSKDPSTKVGAVCVNPTTHSHLSDGFNGFPRGIDDNIPSRWERPEKYKWIEHGERNCLYNALLSGVSLIDSIMYQNWQPTACSGCARGIIQSGIKVMVGPDVPFGGKGKGIHYDVDEVGNDLLEEAGIVRYVIHPSYFPELTHV